MLIVDPFDYFLPTTPRFRNVTSPSGSALFPTFRSPASADRAQSNDAGYSSSESVSSVGSQDSRPLVRKKKREKQHGAGVGGLEDVVEETSTAVFSGFNRGVEDAGKR